MEAAVAPEQSGLPKKTDSPLASLSGCPRGTAMNIAAIARARARNKGGFTPYRSARKPAARGAIMLAIKEVV